MLFRSSDDEIEHTVTLTRPFWLGRTPVTQGQYARLMGTNPSRFKDQSPDLPVETVSWDEAMAFCESQQNVRYIFGFAPNAVLKDMVFPDADEVCVRRALAQSEKERGFAELQYKAKSWKSGPRRTIARIEATPRGADTRYVVTDLEGDPAHLYEQVYCARGTAENLIKRHKSQLASDRTSCRSALANQMRLVLHSAAYWLMRLLSAAVPASEPLATADFDTLRLRLLKVAVRVRETASRVRLAFAANCPDRDLFERLLDRKSTRLNSSHT